MTIFKRIKSLFHSEPEEQVLGYSPAEFRLLFRNPVVADQAELSKAYPKKSSLEPAGIHAVYGAVLIGKGDMENFMTLVDSRFFPESKRQFQGAVVVQSKSTKGDERLCFLVADEFEGHVVKFVTDSMDFLNDIDQCRLAPPPPWVAFKDYNPEWWGGLMQGAQGYYDHYYFFPFFRGLDAEQKKAYCEKFSVSPDWTKALELFYDDDEEA